MNLFTLTPREKAAKARRELNRTNRRLERTRDRLQDNIDDLEDRIKLCVRRKEFPRARALETQWKALRGQLKLNDDFMAQMINAETGTLVAQNNIDLHGAYKATTSLYKSAAASVPMAVVTKDKAKLEKAKHEMEMKHDAMIEGLEDVSESARNHEEEEEGAPSLVDQLIEEQGIHVTSDLSTLVTERNYSNSGPADAMLNSRIHDDEYT